MGQRPGSKLFLQMSIACAEREANARGRLLTSKGGGCAPSRRAEALCAFTCRMTDPVLGREFAGQFLGRGFLKPRTPGTSADNKSGRRRLTSYLNGPDPSR